MERTDIHRYYKRLKMCSYAPKVRSFEKKFGDREKAIKEAVKYCQKHDILREFLKLHASEVLNMLYTEWNMDDALAVRFEEGLDEGIEKGRVNEKLEIARNLLTKGSTPEFVRDITGLDMETIESL